MSNTRRHFEHNCAYFLTNRLARGLPLVPCDYINNILLGVMAKACEDYPNVIISHYLWMTNHYHMIVVTKGDPKEVSGFMNLLNGEIAKAICVFLGLVNVKIWSQRFNPIRLLTPDDVVEKISYLYLNPVTANLVDKACRWPGVSSYGIHEEQSIKCEYLSPSKIQRLPNQRLSKNIDRQLINTSKKGKEHNLTIDPYAWVGCFKDPDSIDSYQIKISNKIIIEEKRLQELRKSPVMGVNEVKTQSAYKHYIPKRKGKRVFCISSCLELRKQYIKLYKDFCERCRLVWQKWQEGYLDYKYPPGAFIPPMWPLANTLKFET